MSRHFENKFKELIGEIKKSGKRLDVLLYQVQQLHVASKADVKNI